MRSLPKFGMKTLTYHEAIPGHHFQISLQQQIKHMPTFRKIIPFTAYTEGWALYAEHLAFENGFFQTPEQEIGHLQADLFRSVRLVVDTGIHYKRWTREQAVDYMQQNTGKSENEIAAEIDRYIVMPGQATAYKIGMLKILELREKAKAKLGAKFLLTEFHDAVLKQGAVPLTILERQIDEYIAAKSVN